MNILPRLLYPIRMIPIVFSHKVIKLIDGWLSSFIWRKRKPKLKMSILQLPSCEGGLDMPSITVYQLCRHLKYLHNWIIDDSHYLVGY